MAKKKRVDDLSIGLAFGCAWAVAVFIFGVGSMFVGTWASAVTWLGQYYVGFAPTFLGSIIGAFWGFLDFFIGAYLVAWFYNKFYAMRH